MTGSPDDIELKIRQLPRRSLSPDLKARVMTTTTLRPAVLSWRDRAWYSSTWRLAAAGACLAILLLDHVSAGLTRTAVAEPDRRAVQEQEQVAQLGEESGMSPEQARVLAARVDFLTLTSREQRTGDVSLGLQ